MRRKKVKQLLESPPGEKACVFGWVRTIREQKSFAFIEVNDGSCLKSLQIVMDSHVPDFKELIEKISTGASIKVEGELVESPGGNQTLELKAEKVFLVGTCDQSYPLQKKRHSFEFLRKIAHLRPRTNTTGAAFRIRNALAFATHQFFQKRGFLYVQTPIITGSDCEGGGELFRVTTLEKQDPEKDFFGKTSYLSVSGQLEAESLALGLSDVYTFGPTFRAENSHTSRHLAEFWMIEPEMAFADLNDAIECATEYLKYCVEYVLKHEKEDLIFFDRFIEKGLIKRLEELLSSPFTKISYGEAISLLQKASKGFEFPVKWGLDLQSEHERYLSEELFKGPVVLSDYPEDIKAFYMRSNPDGKTVSAMDILVPKIGEIVGGSQREERLEFLEKKIEKASLEKSDYWWYLELRKFGTVPHAGFGVGFERLVLFVTGMENIRDVIPFPRYPGHIEF